MAKMSVGEVSVCPRLYKATHENFKNANRKNHDAVYELFLAVVDMKHKLPSSDAQVLRDCCLVDKKTDEVPSKLLTILRSCLVLQDGSGKRITLPVQELKASRPGHVCWTEEKVKRQ